MGGSESAEVKLANQWRKKDEQAKAQKGTGKYKEFQKEADAFWEKHKESIKKGEEEIEAAAKAKFEQDTKGTSSLLSSQAYQYAYNPYAVDVDSQNAYIPAYSYGAPSYSYGYAPNSIAGGAASTDYAMMAALLLGVFMMILVLCFVVNMVVAAGCFMLGKRSTPPQAGKYRVVDHEEV